MSLLLKKIALSILVIAGFAIVSLVYFNPVLQGKVIYQSDIVQYIGMSKQQNTFKAKTGQETYWTNSAFSGMPTYQMGAKYPHHYIKTLDRLLRFLPRPADYLFLYLLGAFICLSVLRVDIRLAALGALAFGFSTYLIIILGVGHNSKAHAIAYMPLVLSGILLVFQKRYVLGFLLTIIAMGLELAANHAQMTYYLLFLVITLGLAYGIHAYKTRTWKHYITSVCVLVFAVCFSIALNATQLLATKEYVKESKRSKSELTIHADGTKKKITSGLSTDYITQFSYGIVESFNLFIPRFMGGSHAEHLDDNSETYDAYRALGASRKDAIEASKRAPMYWGNQPIVEAPAYVGAVLVFLFVLGIFILKGPLKWWLVSGSIMSWVLSLGKNWFFVSNPNPDSNPITNFFIHYIPLYDKFRAVSSIQVILECCIPILGILALAQILKSSKIEEHTIKALKKSVFITGGIALLFLTCHSFLFDFSGGHDAIYSQNYGERFVEALKKDRKSLFVKDTLRTLILVLLAGGTLFLFFKNRLKQQWVIVIFYGLILFDLVSVGRRYVNNEDFVAEAKMTTPFKANNADRSILKDTTHYRIFDLVSGAAKPSYFHNSLNGYNAAELRRYSEVFDFYISKNNMNVLNMLHTKYIIAEDKNGLRPYKNDEAMGNAWFIETIKPVNSADAEILALDTLNIKDQAIYTSQKGELKSINHTFQRDTLATIKLLEVAPNYLKYESDNTHDGFSVFSEIYYPHGWQTFIDGKKTTHHRVNYILRGMFIPKGHHIIEFKFDPEVVKTGSAISLTSSIIVGLLLFGGVCYKFKRIKTFLSPNFNA